MSRGEQPLGRLDPLGRRPGPAREPEPGLRPPHRATRPDRGIGIWPGPTPRAQPAEHAAPALAGSAAEPCRLARGRVARGPTMRGMPRYCSRCGGRLPAAPPTVCEACGYSVFVDAKPGAGAVVINHEGRFLALRRAQSPGTGDWGVPGGFCDGEHPRIAARREITEETGLRVCLGDLIGVYTDRYLSQGEDFPTLHVYYLAVVEPTSRLRLAPDEVIDARWVPFEQPPGRWAFSHLPEVVADAARLVDKAGL
ncbi:MAG TPA: NUDIX hydrolase, partial [Acidimicrobiales bacterium]|nr:NUDIX hydrolase [Acidimicrobiales bacterium]